MKSDDKLWVSSFRIAYFQRVKNYAYTVINYEPYLLELKTEWTIFLKTHFFHQKTSDFVRFWKSYYLSRIGRQNWEKLFSSSKSEFLIEHYQLATKHKKTSALSGWFSFYNINTAGKKRSRIFPSWDWMQYHSIRCFPARLRKINCSTIIRKSLTWEKNDTFNGKQSTRLACRSISPFELEPTFRRHNKLFSFTVCIVSLSITLSLE